MNPQIVMLMQVLSAGKANSYSEYMLILIRMNYCPSQDELGIKESTSHRVVDWLLWQIIIYRGLRVISVHCWQIGYLAPLVARSALLRKRPCSLVYAQSLYLLSWLFIYMQSLEWWMEEVNLISTAYHPTTWLLSASYVIEAVLGALMGARKILMFCAYSYWYIPISVFQTSLSMDFWSLSLQVPDQNSHYYPRVYMHVLPSNHCSYMGRWLDT